MFSPRVPQRVANQYNHPFCRWRSCLLVSVAINLSFCLIFVLFSGIPSKFLATQCTSLPPFFFLSFYLRSLHLFSFSHSSLLFFVYSLYLSSPSFLNSYNYSKKFIDPYTTYYPCRLYNSKKLNSCYNRPGN